MGKQINFFMTNNDEAEFFELLNDLADKIYNINLEILKTENLGEIPHYSVEASIQNSITQFFIVSTDSKIIKSQKGFLERISSDVIEFSRSSIHEKNDDKIFKPGRIWAEFKYYNDKGKTEKKEKWFEEKYKLYHNWIKKNLRPNKDKDFYIGKEAYQLYKEQGYKMMSGPMVEEQF